MSNPSFYYHKPKLLPPGPVQPLSASKAENGQVLELLRPVTLLLYQAIDACLAARLRAMGESTSPQSTVPRSAFLPAAPKSPAELVEVLLREKRQDGISLRYQQTLRSHLNRFADEFPGDIASITAPQIEAWLRGQAIGPRTRNNIRGSVVTLFQFARKQGYLPKGYATEADEIAKARDRGGDIGILTPAQLRMLLAEAPPRQKLYFALAAFTGMRSSELLLLEWEEINFERRFITVAKAKAKTATRRLVPIHPNLMKWLLPYRGPSGRVFRSHIEVERSILFARKSKMEWPRNCLRHSYATYRLALTADAPRVALEMGNSPAKLMTNYRELAHEEEGKVWFSLVPDAVAQARLQGPPSEQDDNCCLQVRDTGKLRVKGRLGKMKMAGRRSQSHV